MKVKSPSRVRLLATPWTAAYQAPPSMGFSRQEYWSGVSLPSPKLLSYSAGALRYRAWAQSWSSAALAARSEEPGRLQSMGSLRVGHDWATSLSLFTFMHWRRKWQPTAVFLPGRTGESGAFGLCNLLQCSSLENPRDWGALWAAIYGVTQSQT